MNFTTLILVSGFCALSFLLRTWGLILDVIAKMRRQLFELYLNLIAGKQRDR